MEYPAMRFSVLVIAFAAATVLTGNLLEAQTIRESQFLFAPQLRATGSYLGVSLAEVDADRAAALKLGEARGVEVTKVEEGSPAENAGLKAGDVLLSYNGENILGVQQFVRLVRETPQGRRIRIQFWRDGKMQSTVATTGEARSHILEIPPGLVGVEVPDLRNFSMPDIPNPLLVWKSSMLGMECEPVDSQLAQYFGVKRGVLVRSVEKGSAAEKAGLKAGDVLTAVGDQSIATPRDVTSFMRAEHQPGKPVSVALVREHKQLRLSVMPPGNPE